jgi:putative transposase
MDNDPQRYRRHRFPPEIINHAVWLYHRFCLSFRDVEDILAERSVIVSHEAIRYWCAKFGPCYAAKLRRRQGRLGNTWFLDEVFVTDKLKSYSAAHGSVMPSVVHDTRRWANNRAEVSHQPTRQRERQMRGFKSAAQAQRFLAVQGVVLNLFRLGRHRLRSANYRTLRMRAFAAWTEVSAA